MINEKNQEAYVPASGANSARGGDQNCMVQFNAAHKPIPSPRSRRNVDAPVCYPSKGNKAPNSGVSSNKGGTECPVH